VAIRKSVEETLVVEGPRDEWLSRCRSALESRGFMKIEVVETLFQLHGNYKKFATWGDLRVELLPSGDEATTLQMTATANVDNVFALFKSPGRRILEEFKTGLRDVSPASASPEASASPIEFSPTAAGGRGSTPRQDG
jgi:hypothetical protein